MPRKTGPSHPPEDKQALGAKLAQARLAAGFDQQAAAARELGVVKQTIHAWEKGTNVIDAIWLRKLAKLYRTSADSLIAGEGRDAMFWPFSTELFERVMEMAPADVAAMETAMWAHLKVKEPEVRHFSVEAEAMLTTDPAPDSFVLKSVTVRRGMRRST